MTPAPPDLALQMGRCREVAEAYAIPVWQQDGVEGDDIIATGKDRASDDFIKVILTDAERRIDPIKRIREHYPNACSLSYERDATALETKSARPSASALANPAEVVAAMIWLSRPSSWRRPKEGATRHGWRGSSGVVS